MYADISEEWSTGIINFGNTVSSFATFSGSTPDVRQYKV